MNRRPRLRAGILMAGSAGMVAACALIFTLANAQTQSPNQAPSQTKPQFPAKPQAQLTLNKAERDKAVVAKPATSAPAADPNEAVRANSLPPQTKSTAPGPFSNRPLRPFFIRAQGLMAVNWAKAVPDHIRSMSRAQPNVLMTRLAANDVNRTRLPLLMPRNGGLINVAQARMHSFGDAYAMNLPQKPGIQINVYGNRSVVLVDKGSLTRRAMIKLPSVNEAVQIQRTEDGFTATFDRFGVAYSMDVSCDDTTSPECASDSFIRKAIGEFSEVTLGQDAQNEAIKSGGIKPQAFFIKPQTSVTSTAKVKP